MRMSAERRSANDGYDSDGSFRDEEEDFPTLGNANAMHSRRRDPAASRWVAAVKSSRPAPARSSSDSFGPPGRAPSTSVGRPSPRLLLRPPQLLPTLTTGAQVSESYAKYREKFLRLGAERSRSLSKAAEAWQRGDGAGAKEWSRTAQSQDRERLAAGREAAGKLVLERKVALKEAVLSGTGRDGRVDIVADRSVKGKEVGGGLGVCLGVAAPDSSIASPEERTEAAVDLQ